MMTGFDAIQHYDYALPQAQIATHPAVERSASRLMVLNKASGRIDSDALFPEILAHLEAGDLLVFNDTQVVPARVFAKKATGGKIELLITDVVAPVDSWTEAQEGPVVLAMTRSSKPARVGTKLTTASGRSLEVLKMLPGRRAELRILGRTSVADFLVDTGTMPLPPYIVRERKERGEAYHDDADRYQTVYASKPGAVAAPTAGLHFTQGLLDTLAQNGVETAFVTLDVGPGTFRPVTAERLSEHPMHREWYSIPAGLGTRIAACKSNGHRVFAIGTTTVRVLESEYRLTTPFEPGRRSTSLLLRPGSTFGVVDGILTNFHLPRSTLLALVAGFAGYKMTMEAYELAVERGFRFYSYGDAMLVTP